MSITVSQAEFSSNAPEVYRLGEVVAKTSIAYENLAIPEELKPRGIYSVEVADPYVEQYSPEVIIRVKTEELASDEQARQRREMGSWQRQPDTAYFDAEGNPQNKHGWGDPVSRTAFFGNLNSPAIDAWRTNIPSAKALMYLSDPNSNLTVENSQGNIVQMDETGRMWLSLCTDAVGIRSRATVMAEVVKDYAEARADMHVRWLSVACGTALPTMKAAIHAGVKPELLLADLDKNAMEETAKLGAEIGFEGVIDQHRINIFNPESMKKLGEKLDNDGGRPDLIDLMGIFEYTGENLGVDPIEFLKANYDLLAPGGRLVFGQMRSDRPVADFTMGTVSWPYVEMRAPSEFLKVIKEAGIPLDNTSIYLPKDGVYTVGVIDKPLA